MLIHGLALAFFAAPWTREGLRANGQAALGAKPRWLPALVKRVLSEFPDKASIDPLEDFLAQDSAFDKRRPLMIRRWFLPAASMQVVPGAPANFPLVEIRSSGELAHWLGTTNSELDWFADLRGQNARTNNSKLRHYHWQWVAKRSSGYRLLERPKPRIKAIQRQISRDLLSRIPSSDAAHGFVPGRSIHSFVRPHSGKRVVVRLDLANFFATISFARVRTILERVGYPHPVAMAIAGLATTRAPHNIIDQFPDKHGNGLCHETKQQLLTSHLPQGAPTSPTIANLAAFPLDRRLTGLANKFGGHYTRYVDDLAFSGDAAFARKVNAFVAYATSIIIDEGFHPNFRKTRIMFSGSKQHLCGLIVNKAGNIPRSEYDNLRALLHKAQDTGLDAQNNIGHTNFRAHVRGKIAYIESTNPRRGEKLLLSFQKIPIRP